MTTCIFNQHLHRANRIENAATSLMLKGIAIAFAVRKVFLWFRFRRAIDNRIQSIVRVLVDKVLLITDGGCNG